MSYKKWFHLFLINMGIIFIPVLGLMSFNFYIDPYWNFGHAHANNDYQNGFDERLQKTNLLANDPPEFDSLLIGSSRVTYMNTDAFVEDQVFNYGLSSLHIKEIRDYIAYAKKANGGKLENIYMEAPLNAYNAGTTMARDEPATYIAQAEDWILDYTSLFSKDTWEKSMENYETSKADEFPMQRSYTRDNQVRTTYGNDKLEKAKIAFEKRFDLTNYKTEFAYMETYKQELQKIKRDNPDANFVVFSEVAHEDRVKVYLKNPNYLDAYERSIREIIDVFGSYTAFILPNEWSQDDQYWLDLFHYYPPVGDGMIRAMETGEGEGTYFMKLDETTIDEYMNKLEAWIHE